MELFKKTTNLVLIGYIDIKYLLCTDSQLTFLQLLLLRIPG